MFEGFKNYLYYRKMEKECYEILEALGELKQANKHEVKNIIIHLKEDNPRAISYYFAFKDKFNQERNEDLDIGFPPIEEELKKNYPILPTNSEAIAEINRGIIKLDKEIYK